jgi:two-component system cell cycle response regulator DivK
VTTILIADDRREVHAILGSQLQSLGFSVQSAINGQEVVELAERGSIDLILMDINMPEMDGYEAAEVLKAGEATKSIPIVICTAHPLEGDREGTIALGCDGYLEKPIDLKKLEALLSTLLNTQMGADVNAVVNTNANSQGTPPPNK